VAGSLNLNIILGACGITKFERMFHIETAEQLARILLFYDAHVSSKNRRLAYNY
jgi:hypothetical protein